MSVKMLPIRLMAVAASLMAVSDACAGLVTNSVEFSTLGSSPTRYGIVNWSSTTAGSFSDSNYSESYTVTLSSSDGYESAGTGASSFNQSFQQSGLDGQDMSISESGFVNLDSGNSNSYTFSWTGGSVDSVLVYVGTGDGNSPTENIRRGSLTVSSGFEMVSVAAKNTNFLVGDGSTFSSTLGTTGTVLDPLAGAGDPQTAGVLLLRRIDGNAFSSFSISGNSGGADRFTMQLGLPVSTPEPSSLLLAGLGSFCLIFVRRRHSQTPRTGQPSDEKKPTPIPR